MKTNILSYVLRVWLTSVVLSPIIVSLYMSWVENSPPDAELVPLMLMWGGALSVPSLLILGMLCHYLVHRKNNVKDVKIWLTIIGIILTYAPFWVLNAFSFANNSGATVLFWPYCVTIVAGIWFYKLKGMGEVRTDEALV